MGVEFKGKNELMDKLRRIFTDGQNSELRVGFFRDAVYPHYKTGRVEPTKKGQLSQKNRSVPEVALIHEFGAPRANIPARSFMRPAIEQMKNPSDEIKQDIAAAMSIQTENEHYFDPLSAGRLGEIIKGVIQDNILQDPDPPGNAKRHQELSDDTLRQRKYRKMRAPNGEMIRAGKFPLGSRHKITPAKIAGRPLVDTGFLLNSVTWEVDGIREKLEANAPEESPPEGESLD